MLINVGMYREDNMGEPALAALIQEDIGANRGQPPTGGEGDGTMVGVEQLPVEPTGQDATRRYFQRAIGKARLDQPNWTICASAAMTRGSPFNAASRMSIAYSSRTKEKAAAKALTFGLQRSFAFAPAAIARLGDAGERIVNVGPQLLDELSNIIYLGPVRRLAQRDYVWGGRMPATIGDDGSKAVDALIASGMTAGHARRRGQIPPSEADLFENTARWLKRMDLADGLSVKALGGSARHELLIAREGTQVNLKDVGVGVSQVLPVIVAALFAAPGNIVIVEEPESHLHPLAAALLAELFAEVSKEHGVQFIVETHSEHLFRRMQTLIARQQVVNSDCAMYFVERSGNSATLKALTANEYGAITNWPDKFFGDAIGEAREQARARVERQVESAGGTGAGG